MIKELSTAETVELVKRALYKEFCGRAGFQFCTKKGSRDLTIKFNGTIDSSDVMEIAKQYKGIRVWSRSIRGASCTIVREGKEELEHWLLPDGTFIESESRLRKPNPDAILVKSGIDYIVALKVPWKELDEPSSKSCS